MSAFNVLVSAEQQESHADPGPPFYHRIFDMAEVIPVVQEGLEIHRQRKQAALDARLLAVCIVSDSHFAVLCCV
jgi:hypothetical protein